MKYVHDIHVNWVDGGSRKHEIPEYFEWKDEDPIELYDTIPAIAVTSKVFNILEDGYVEIPFNLLNEIHKVAKRINPDTQRKNTVEYCFIISDRKKVLVINTEGDNRPNLKSRLVPRMELFILNEMKDEPTYQLDIQPDEFEEYDDSSLEARFLSVNPSNYIGLTRTEREMKQIVLDCLFNLNCSENLAEVKYWYIELFPEMIGDEELKTATHEMLINDLFDYLKEGWTKRHEEWGTLMVKVAPNDIYKDEWASLVNPKVIPVK